MRKPHPQHAWKIAIFSFVLLLLASALTLHVTASPGKTPQQIEATNKPSHSDSNLDPLAGQLRQNMEGSVFAEFDDWNKQYRDGRFGKDAEQLKRGEILSVKRRELFKELIRLAPEAALERAVSAESYKRLPASISKNLERHVSAYGDLLVYVVDKVDHSTGRMTESRTEREVVIGDATYTAFVYGRREAMTTKLNIPLQGIVLDGLMAVDEDPARILQTTEYESLNVDTSDLSEYSIAAEVGGEVLQFSNQVEYENFVHQQLEWEAKIGPTRPKTDVVPLSNWTEGLKKVLIIRVDFSDKPGEPVDANNQPLTILRAQNLMNLEVSPFFVSNSYNKTLQQATVTTLVRLPQTFAFYQEGNNYSTMLTDARNAARSAGFETNNFDFDIVAFSYSQNFDWAGRGMIGGKGTWLNGYFDLRVTAHELGHNYGLIHANLWQSSDGSTIGNGSNIEYGDPFDQMGHGGDAKYHFNARYKRILDWLTDTNVQTVTVNGVYRIFAHDSLTPGGVRVLKVRKNSTKNYWIEFRQLFTDNPDAMNGAMIHWDYLSRNFRETQILDMTPNTSGNAFDAPLLIGQNFYDSENRIRLTVMGKANTIPASLDVKVELNVGCTFSLGTGTQNFPASGGEGNITVNTQAGCKASATSNDSWLNATPTDTNTLRYIVAANYGTQPRTGTINIAGQTFTVQQGAATTACVARPSGLVAWWRGEGNALDQTGVNNGTLIDNITFGGGKVGGGFLGAYDNNGGTVEVPDSSSLALNRSMTFEGWLRLSSYGGTVIGRRDNATTGNIASTYEIDIFSSGHLGFFISYNSSQGMGAVSPSPLPLNEFVHFAASLDDATNEMKVYINGNLVTQARITQRPYTLDPNAAPKVRIGNINGITDELSAYNRALSASEIRAIYDTGTAAAGATGKCLLPAEGNPGNVQFSPTAYSRNENAGTATITVSRTGGAAAFGVEYNTSNGTATAGLDYTATNGTLNFAPGETSKTFNVPILDDAAIESNETVNLSLSKPTGGATLVAPNPIILTITDNDTLPILSINNVSVAEGNTGTVAANFNVTLNTVSTQTITVNYSTSNGTATAGSDYQATSGMLTFTAGQTTKQISVIVNGDTTVEPNETFNVTLSNALNAGLPGAPGVGTIVNDDAAPTLPTIQFSASNYTVGEGAASANVTVTRAGDTAPAVSLSYRTEDTDTFTVGCFDRVGNQGSAYARCDFATSVGILSFAPGQTIKTISIPLIDDGHQEGTETFSVRLSNASGATLGAITLATVTLQDNDGAATQNPVTTSFPFFVRQQYLDFLSREADSGGLNAWLGVLNGCADAFTGPAIQSRCDRIFVSGEGFFRSQEFQLKGFYVFRFYKVAFNRLPQYLEVVADMSFVAGQTAEEVYARKAQLAAAITERPEFQAAYVAMTNTQYVTSLMNRYNLQQVTTPDPAQPDTGGKVVLTTTDLTNRLNANQLTRAQVLRAVADSDEVASQEFNNAFVGMQYYGYLRRKPDDAGFQAWLRVLQAGNVRTMVDGFLNSTEYKLRFGQL